MNALRTFNQLRPTDDQLDEITSARIWKSIAPDSARAEDTRLTDGEEIEWVSPFEWSDRHRSHWTSVAAVAILIVGVGGIAAALKVGGRTYAVAPAAIPTESSPAPVPPSASQVALAEAPTTNARPTTMQDLPSGGLHLGGQVPVCSRLATDTYRCTLPKPFDPSFPDALNDVGMAELYVDDSAIVSGGCRTTTPDAHEWLCYVGKRAVDENIISGALLGSPGPTGFVSG
jgi:hypothetical protein